MLTLLLDRSAMILMVRFHGLFISEDIATHDAFVSRLVQRDGPVRGIIDLSQVTIVAVPLTRFVEVSRRPQLVPGSQRILVASEPAMTELARVFQNHQELVGNTVPRIVQSLGEAYAAMGVSGDNFEPVDFNW